MGPKAPRHIPQGAPIALRRARCFLRRVPFAYLGLFFYPYSSNEKRQPIRLTLLCLLVVFFKVFQDEPFDVVAEGPPFFLSSLLSFFFQRRSDLHHDSVCALFNAVGCHYFLRSRKMVITFRAMDAQSIMVIVLSFIFLLQCEVRGSRGSFGFPLLQFLIAVIIMVMRAIIV